ncbi:MAG TPA: PIN domain-containing protein [Candidatus Methylomirabilis sp.]|nr:PIN domain-containing protein [Candidatus Methylomirabilis sp.]
MPSTLLFVDTSAWYALLDRKDRNHGAATQFARDSRLPFMTSTYILDETLTLLKRHLGHSAAVQFGERVWAEEVARLIRITPEDETRAWDIFTGHPDKGFSYTDCTSFALMERLGIDSAFAFDAHFDQHGRFVRLPIG